MSSSKASAFAFVWLAFVIGFSQSAHAADRMVTDLMISAVKHGQAGPVELLGSLRNDLRKQLQRPNATFKITATAVRPNRQQPACKHIFLQITSAEMFATTAGDTKPFLLALEMQMCPDGSPPGVLDPVESPLVLTPLPLQSSVPGHLIPRETPAKGEGSSQ